MFPELFNCFLVVEKVSVIIGVYNCASTLQEALDSLYAQTFQDFEIILCDDGSIDDTYAIALQNQKLHSNIVLLKNERNLGLNQTLNKCLEIARGEYIARMDGDDLSLPTRFEREVEFLEGHPEYAIVSGPMNYFDEKGIFKTGKGKGEVKAKDFVKGSPFCHAPCMVRREAYKAVGGYTVDKRLLRVEDYHLWFKMYAVGFKGYNLEEPIYEMRDDRNAYKRRTIQNRLNEIYVKYIGYKMLRIPFYYYIWLLVPIIKIFVPNFLYLFMHKRKFRI